MGKETNSADLELERLADLLAYLIEKYGDKIELESLPDPAGMPLMYWSHYSLCRILAWIWYVLRMALTVQKIPASWWSPYCLLLQRLRGRISLCRRWKDGSNTMFDAHLIRMILDNPVYCGKIAFGRRKREKKVGTRDEYHLVKQDEYAVRWYSRSNYWYGFVGSGTGKKESTIKITFIMDASTEECSRGIHAFLITSYRKKSWIMLLRKL